MSGEYKQPPGTVAKTQASKKIHYDKIRSTDYKLIMKHVKKQGWVKSRELPEVLNREISTTIKRTRLNKLVEDRKLKQYIFGLRDIRYVTPEFTLDEEATKFIKKNKDVTITMLNESIGKTYNITEGVMHLVLQRLQKANIIKQTRGYRVNYYTIKGSRDV